MVGEVLRRLALIDELGWLWARSEARLEVGLRFCSAPMLQLGKEQLGSSDGDGQRGRALLAWLAQRHRVLPCVRARRAAGPPNA